MARSWQIPHKNLIKLYLVFKTLISGLWKSAKNKQFIETYFFVKNCWSFGKNSGSLWLSCLALLPPSPKPSQWCRSNIVRLAIKDRNFAAGWSWSDCIQRRRHSHIQDLSGKGENLQVKWQKHTAIQVGGLELCGINGRSVLGQTLNREIPKMEEP